jgi:hypothetical protein
MALKLPLTEPSLTGIQAALGLSGVTNYGVLMRPDLFGYGELIGKYNIHKPYNRPGLHKITYENKRVGPRASEGIFWGLKAGSTSWEDIHSATWEYVEEERPSGGIDTSPFRPHDYVSEDGTTGYNGRNVRPTLSGIVDQSKVYINGGDPLTVRLVWTPSDGTNVDVSKCSNTTSPNLNNWYLCVMVDTWCVAMYNGEHNNAIVPILYNGKQGDEFLSPDLPPELGTATTRSVTYFLADLDGTDNATAAAIKAGTWKNIQGLSVSRLEAISIPEAAGLRLPFVIVDNTWGEWIINSFSATFSGFILGLNCTTAPEIYSRYRVILQFPAGTAAIKEFTMNAGSTIVLANLMWDFADGELPMAMPNSTTSYNYTVRLYGIDDAGTQEIMLAQQTGTVTFTVSGTGTN